MSSPAAPLPCTGSPHLDLLVEEIDQLVARVHDEVAAADAGTVARRRSAEDALTIEASLRLDGGLRTAADGGMERAGTWLDALGGAALDAAHGGERDGTIDDGVDERTLAELAALERAGVEAGLRASDLADAFARASSDAGGLGTALAVLHARLTTGLVAPERAGMLRRGARVVHDASIGRVLFFPTDSDLLPDAWDALLRHVTGPGAGGAAARLPAAVRAAVLHLELVRHQPFDAANGRLARAAARLVLVAEGLLPASLGAPDAVLGEDPLGYHEEVGASLRRRDATLWVERALEAHVTALRRSVDAIAPATDGPSPLPEGHEGHEGHEVIEALESEFTVADVIALTGATSTLARRRCAEWVVAGHAQHTVGSRGLRYRRSGAVADAPAAGVPTASASWPTV